MAISCAPSVDAIGAQVQREVKHGADGEHLIDQRGATAEVPAECGDHQDDLPGADRQDQREPRPHPVEVGAEQIEHPPEGRRGPGKFGEGPGVTGNGLTT